MGILDAPARTALNSPSRPFITAALDLPSPYGQDNQFVHPDVVDAGVGGWNGYRYWMAATPYPHADAGKENPCVYASTDAINWVVPAGLVNPIDGKPSGNALNSDVDMVLVAGTMYLFYREHCPSPLYEKIQLRTSTNGTTWSAEQTVLDTTASNPNNRLKIISPGVIHDGTQFVMWSSKDQTTIERRTSTDGVTWASPTTCTLTNYTTANGVSHVDVFKGNGTALFILIQDAQASSDAPETPSSRGLWMGRSTDAGATWTFAATPLLDSSGLATRSIYRACGLWESRNGLDWLRVWYSGIDFDNAGIETWRIGYTEGYAPDQAGAPIDSIVLPGSLRLGRDLAARAGTFRRLYARLFSTNMGVFSYLRAWRARLGLTYVEQPEVNTINAPWNTELGYAAGDVPPLVIASGKARTWAAGDRAEIRMHQRSTDISGIAAADYVTIRMTPNGTLQLGFVSIANGTTTLQTFTTAGDYTASRDVIATRNVKGTSAVYGAKGDFGATADGTTPADSPLRVLADNIRITTKRTPSSGTDNALYNGCIFWDDNYLYIKTAASVVKRVPLSTF